MVWNHRVVKREQKLPDGMVDITYHIHEAYYDKVGAKADSITSDAVAPLGHTLLELREELERMVRAVSLAICDPIEKDTVLNYEDF
ncbi:hypothetical protein LCGC14_1687890 [marine sediment metagenome]|uniref:Uncharacterized protein n=1 Tax=marine sediment metagenome TaxID=412755 RepID=A0A0F9HM39_9ZZZZ